MQTSKKTKQQKKTAQEKANENKLVIRQALQPTVSVRKPNSDYLRKLGSKSSQYYLKSLFNPRDYPGAAIPDDFTVDSQKFQVQANFNATAGGTADNACGFVAFCPDFMFANDSNCIVSTNANHASLVINGPASGAVGLDIRNSNSPYVLADFYGSAANTIGTNNITAARRVRLVSAMLEVTSTASVTAQPGEMLGIVMPLHESMNGLAFEQLAGYRSSCKVVPAIQGNTLTVLYTPVWPSEMTYHQMEVSGSNVYERAAWILDPTAIPVASSATVATNTLFKPHAGNVRTSGCPYMGVMFDGSAEISFNCKIVCNFEAVGLNVGTLTTPSPSDPDGFATAKQVASIAPSVGSGPDFGSKLIAGIPKLLGSVTSALEGNWLGAATSGMDFVQDFL